MQEDVKDDKAEAEAEKPEATAEEKAPAAEPKAEPKAKAEASGDDDKPEKPSEEDAIFGEPDENEKDWATETYGEQVAGVMEKAGLNPMKANDYWQKHGTLPEKAFEKLAEAGYPRAMVDAYLAGVDSQREKAAKQEDEVANAFLQVAGDEPTYNRMVDWANKNYTAAEIQDYLVVTGGKDPAAIRLAVSSLKARFEQANGKLPKVDLKGPAPGQAEKDADQGDRFKNTQEIRAAMADPRYQKDAAYRREVEAKVVRSNVFGKMTARR